MFILESDYQRRLYRNTDLYQDIYKVKLKLYCSTFITMLFNYIHGVSNWNYLVIVSLKAHYFLHNVR